MSSPILIEGQELGVELTGYHWGIADLDGSDGTGRSDITGEMDRDRIGRARSLRIDIAPNTSAAAMSRLLKLVKPQFVNITYFDAEDCDWRIDRFYVADRGVQSMNWPENLEPGVSTDFSGISYQACSMEFVGKGNPEEDELENVEEAVTE